MKTFIPKPDIVETERRPPPGCAPAWRLAGYICPGYLLASLCLMIGQCYRHADDAGVLRKLSRQWKRLIKELLAVNNFNRNLQIYDFVLGCKAGRDWARNLLGPRRIRDWLWRYDVLEGRAVLYTFALPAGPPPKPVPAGNIGGHRTYHWKPLTLLRLPPCPATPGRHKLAAPILTGRAPRKRRGPRPAVFLPWELGVIDTPISREKRRVAAHRARVGALFKINHRPLKTDAPRPLPGRSPPRLMCPARDPP